MVNTTYYGEMDSNKELRAEFLQECTILDRNAI